MKDLTRTMEITMKELEIDDEEESTEKLQKDPVAPITSHPLAASAPTAPDKHDPVSPSDLHTLPTATPPRSGNSTPSGSKLRIPARPLLTEKSDEDTRMGVEGMTQEERDRKKEKKKGLSKEQKDELAQYDLERRKVREERINTLAAKLVDRICVWTETDKGADVTHSFNEKTKV